MRGRGTTDRAGSHSGQLTQAPGTPTGIRLTNATLTPSGSGPHTRMEGERVCSLPAPSLFCIYPAAETFLQC